MTYVAWTSLLVAIGAVCLWDGSLGKNVAKGARFVTLVAFAIFVVSLGLVEMHVVA